jgi:hypothetical protein
MTGTRNGTHEPELPPLQPHRPSRLGLLVWWLCFALVGVLISWAVLQVASLRVEYLFVVSPICGVLLFPAAWAANRWLTPKISSRLRRS